MNREIKFRGKNKESGEWCFGSFLIIDNNKNKPLRRKPIIKEYKILSYIPGDRYTDGWQKISINQKTIGQFTGLKDKNGKEIYENDIVKLKNTGTMLVIYKTAKASFTLIKFTDRAYDYYFGEAVDASECEVIGNIHDNSELIK
ncbi:hypothetical protein EZS27_014443 [termite gut metagenome]|uniref:YopX protein domain-containing protein n=1 Tax=termite gut metagenome TaxID=433724 RepID=A0A5J4RVJ1_9ZZZZ